MWQQLQRIESLAEQISAAQAAHGNAPEGTNLPLNALRLSLNRAARPGSPTHLLLHAPSFCFYTLGVLAVASCVQLSHPETFATRGLENLHPLAVLDSNMEIDCGLSSADMHKTSCC